MPTTRPRHVRTARCPLREITRDVRERSVRASVPVRRRHRRRSRDGGGIEQVHDCGRRNHPPRAACTADRIHHATVCARGAVSRRRLMAANSRGFRRERTSGEANWPVLRHRSRRRCPLSASKRSIRRHDAATLRGEAALGCECVGM
jgi:hypothetical protein